ncbi:MAG: AmmeMemoRadiSam system protein B [Candidatus Altiarchaeales archaeon]|nr:AmmeMemoRadiSam system protein B [Candidatus Altiarchaeales archaeon]MBD3417236.1 AmmeMemoRadiSam system protein B [Candidatus Altiarchaeales archaeon]
MGSHMSRKKKKKDKGKKTEAKERQVKKKKGKEGDRVMDAILVGGIIIVTAVMAYVIFNQAGSADISGERGNITGTSTTLTPTYRRPAVAGAFYASEPHKLSDDIDRYLGDAEDYPGVYGIRGLISPHAGYRFSGQVAAYGYRQLMNSRYETVIVMGPSHRHYLKGASIADADFYKTPLGDVPVSPKVKEMLEEDVFTYEPEAHEREHSVEVQVPFLQKVLPPFKLIPVVVGDVDPKVLAAALEKYVDEDTLVIASTDLSHYHEYDEAVGLDEKTIEAIVGLDYVKMAREGDCCGKIPTMALMLMAYERGWRTMKFDYRNSGDTSGDASNGVVGYASIGFYDGLNAEEQELLLDLAQKALESHYSGVEMKYDYSSLPPKLREVKGCFVTLNKDGELRGCIGHLAPMRKLHECVMENTLNAALHDSRFKPVREDELEDVRIEISVLSEPKELHYDSPEDLLAKLIPGVDGVILKNGMRQSTYLPVVWEQLPDKEEFLSHLCLKQGSPANCWRTSEVLTYQAQEFHQEGFK